MGISQTSNASSNACYHALLLSTTMLTNTPLYRYLESFHSSKCQYHTGEQTNAQNGGKDGDSLQGAGAPTLKSERESELM